jgi:excisionase family DNA binding protein
MAATLSVREAAEELGVHYMTVYRYVRIGRLPATKDGAEWRIRAADLASFTNEPKPGRGGADWGSRLYQRLVNGDEAGSWNVIEAALASAHDATGVYTDVLGPAMRRIGAEWAEGSLDVAIEHRASAIASRLVGRLGARMRPRGRHKGTVVLGSPAGDRHSLPVAMVADVLRASGYEVTDLGADVPDESFEMAVSNSTGLVAVGIGVSVSKAIPAARRLIGRLRRAIADDVLVLTGGAAIESAGAVGSDFYAADAVEATEIISRER